MIAGGLHDDYVEPPDIPAFNLDRKRAKKENISDAFTGAALAICKALSPTTASESGSASSPSKVITLRMKNYEQLKCLKQLKDEGIMEDHDYVEQKEKVMGTLCKL